MLRHLHFRFDAVPHTPLLVIPSQVGSSPSCLFFLTVLFYAFGQSAIYFNTQSVRESVTWSTSQSVTHSLSHSVKESAGHSESSRSIGQ